MSIYFLQYIPKKPLFKGFFDNYLLIELLPSDTREMKATIVIFISE